MNQIGKQQERVGTFPLKFGLTKGSATVTVTRSKIVKAYHLIPS